MTKEANTTLVTDYNEISFKNPLILVPFITSIFLTTYLFYLDEGYYSFKWMLEPGAWIVFSIYVFIFGSVQVFLLGLFFNIIPSMFHGRFKLTAIGAISLLGMIFSGFILYFIFG